MGERRAREGGAGGVEEGREDGAGRVGREEREGSGEREEGRVRRVARRGRSRGLREGVAG